MNRFTKFRLAILISAPLAVPAQPARPAPGQPVETVNFQGARRIPQSTLMALISTKPGSVYSEDTVQRDITKLLDTKRFDDIHVDVGVKSAGVVVTFVLKERVAANGRQVTQPRTVAEILDRFKE
jgi:outer membrane protein insertion porin family